MKRRRRGERLIKCKEGKGGVERNKNYAWERVDAFTGNIKEEEEKKNYKRAKVCAY